MTSFEKKTEAYREGARLAKEDRLARSGCSGVWLFIGLSFLVCPLFAVAWAILAWVVPRKKAIAELPGKLSSWSEGLERRNRQLERYRHLQNKQ